jgi:two-component system response regulator AtoC
LKILITDDEPDQLEMLGGFLQRQGYEVLSAGDGEQALALLQREPVQLALLDHRMPGMTGDEVLARMKTINPMLRAIMITAFGDVDMAVRVMKLGADDFLQKPVDLQRLLEKIQQLELSGEEARDLDDVEQAMEQAPLPLQLIGDGPAMREVLSLVRRVADSPWNVLIRGETGTGKELIARLVHLLGPNPDAPFVEVNCAAIPETLFESELFGHEKGAFTGAAKQRRGRFELAQGGTLFLDEVGELPPPLQSKLLRALQEKRFSRVGGEADIEVEVRVVTASNRDLAAMVNDGGFREDLYYRLNVLEIELPPLRRRREDIPALVAHFVGRYARGPVSVAPETMDILVKYAYPGNVRELEHSIQRSLTLARGSRLRPVDLPPRMRLPGAADTGALQERLEALERDMLAEALENADWVQTRAAERLGISERVLRYKMGKYGLHR